MKLRTIPYGYQFTDGAVAVHPQERDTVMEICKAYLDGKSLLQIAEHLNADGVEYLPSVTGWNKARLKRIIEDERYLGRESYPAILDKETFDALQRLKAERNTRKNCDRATDIFQISVPVKCPVCGRSMRRHSDSRLKSVEQRWTCQNPECKKRIAKSDEELLREITKLLNRAISAPEMIRIPTATDREPCPEVRKLDNEIGRMLESINSDKDALRKAVLRRVSAAYRDIPNEIYTAKRLRAVFANAEPLSSFSSDLFCRTVKAIRFHEDGTIGILLTNDQEIGKEGLYGNSDSAAAAKNGSANPGDG